MALLLKVGEDAASTNRFFSYPLEAILANVNWVVVVSAAEDFMLDFPDDPKGPSNEEGVACHEEDSNG